MKRDPTPAERHDANRLKALFLQKKAERGFTQEDAAAALGWSQGAVSHYLNGRNPLNIDAALKFAKFLGVPLSAFSPRLASTVSESIAGLDQALSQAAAAVVAKTPEPDIAAQERRQQVDRFLESLPPADLLPLDAWDSRTPLDDDELEVPLFKEVELSAGPGAAHAVEANGRRLRFSRATMRAAGVDEAAAACATLSGNSMEPLILDGSTIGIDRSKTRIVDGELYAIDHDGMLRVKYIYRLPGGGIRLRSENTEEHPDEQYDPAAAAKIRVLGWVFWWSTVRRWRGR